LHLLLTCLLQALETCGVCIDRLDICLKDDWLSRCLTDYCTQPPQVGRAPRRSARIATIVSAPQGFEPARGGFDLAEGLFASPAEVADGFVVHRGHRDRG
jgi:hypothetical protein